MLSFNPLAADVDNAVCQLSGCRGAAVVCPRGDNAEVQLLVIREGMEGDAVSAPNVRKIGHIYYEQQRAQYGALWDRTNDVDDR